MAACYAGICIDLLDAYSPYSRSGSGSLNFLSGITPSNALARYLIGLPGGLLAAYALREYALNRISPYNVPKIVRAMQLSGISMAVYALAAGLIVPPVSFFPGNWIE